MTESASRRLVPVDPDDDPADGPEVIAEQAVLGAAVRSPDDAAQALALLRPEYFSRNAHRAVFEAVERLSGKGLAVDPEDGPGTAWPAAVLGELAAAGIMHNVGAPGMGTGGAFLHSLMQRAGSVAYHAAAVTTAARQRGIRAAIASCASLAARPGFDPDADGEQVRKIIDDAMAFAAPVPLRPNSEAVLRVLEAIEAGAVPGLPTGYPDLDDAIGALRPGELIVIAARPGVGKTQLGFCIADHAGTRLQVPVLFASLEMTEDELTRRRIAATAQVSLHDLVRHQVSDAQWQQIGGARDRLLDTRLYVDETSHASLGHIRGRLRAMARAGDAARLLVIDYLGFMSAPRAETRQQEVAALARGAKMLAREHSIPVILLAQLNRGPESRADKVPVLADLRESGEVEQTADIVILLHREDAYEPESPRAGEIDLLIRKNRQGPQTTLTMCHQGHYGRIVPMAPAAWSPSAKAAP